MSRPVPQMRMLWEDVDARQTLTDRFGFADAQAADTWLRSTLAAHWAIEVRATEEIVLSAGNALAWLATDRGALVAKWSVVEARFAALRRTADLTAWLAARSVPVSAPVPARDGTLQVEVDAVSLGLQRVVPAAILEVSDEAQVHAVGASLARLHQALAHYQAQDAAPDHDRTWPPLAHTPPGPAEFIEDWMGLAPAHLPAEGLAVLAERVAATEPLTEPAQWVHGDVRASNVLCRGPEVVAWLDLEEVRRDHPVIELARSAVLLGTRFRDWGPVPPEVRDTFLAGYESVRPLTAVERTWWGALVLWFSLAQVPAGDDPTGWAEAALVEARRRRGDDEPDRVHQATVGVGAGPRVRGWIGAAALGAEPDDHSAPPDLQFPAVPVLGAGWVARNSRSLPPGVSLLIGR